MATIDVHQHLWPEQLIALLARRSRPPKLSGATLELPGGSALEVDLAAHDLDTRLALLDRYQIDTALVSLEPTLGLGMLAEEEWEELAGAYEEGIRDVAAASSRIVPLAAGAMGGFAGACVAAGALLDVDGLAGLLDDLESSGSFLFVHPGAGVLPAGAPDWWSAVVEDTAQMQAAYAVWLDRGAERWPRLPVVFAILAGGGPFQLERLRSSGVSGRDSLHENVLFDTASYGNRALELCLSTLGVGQLVFGTDVPALDPEAGLDAVRGFGDAVTDALCHRNPSRLLG